MPYQSTGDSLSGKLYKSRKVLLEQLDHLGYDVSSFTDFSINDIYILNENKQLSFMVQDKNGRKKYIYYHITKALRPAHIIDLIEELYHAEEVLTKEDELCIIIKENVNSTITAALDDILLEENIFITVRGLNTMQTNILNNTLVPKHEILSTEEKEAFMKKYNIKDNNSIPEIGRFDPVSIIIGLRPEQVCKITRPNKTSVESLYYRICC
jgi:DNA-directed RNA polymerase subunit H (RpoH/RPB5)